MAASMETRPNATTIDVAKLVDDVWRGRIRIPHFQRDYRWGIDDVLKLFDSIVRGYPIGSLLLWDRPAGDGLVRLGALTIDAPAMENALWVVDGQQRITSLANALHPTGAEDPRFALCFDLDSKKFVRSTSQTVPTAVPLPVLFDLQRLIQWFADRPYASDRLTEASAVTTALRQFQIPAYQVTSENPVILQDIFDRMNNYGKRLRRAEVFSALFAGTECEANTSLTIGRIGEEVSSETQFGEIDGDTILRAILARRGADVEREIRREFDADRVKNSDFPDESRDAAYQFGAEAVSLAARFLQNDAGVPHISFVPYRFLLVVLVRFFAHHPDPDRHSRRLLRRWFWRAARNGTAPFRGGTAGATRLLCSQISAGSMAKSVQNLLRTTSSHKNLVPARLKPFRTNDANGKIVLCALWATGPRSILDASPFSIADLAASISNSPWTPIDALRQIRPARAIPESYRRSVVNRVLMPSDLISSEDVELALSRQLPHLDYDEWRAILGSHGVSEEAAGYLANDNLERFCELRSASLRTHVGNFLKRTTEWDFEDTPPLEDLVIDELDEDANVA